MKVAIVHYHLDLGGVSQTIRSSSSLLARRKISHVVLCGTDPVSPCDTPHAVVPGLHYVDRCPVARSSTAGELVERMRTTAAAFLGSAPDIWHVHNHSLGKNPKLTDAIALLAQDGERLVLHIHDLAEDGRPALFARIRNHSSLYPVSPRIRYAFLNQRDRENFTSAGLPIEHSEILASPPERSGAEIPQPDSSRAPLLFAPVRGIRRKNLGELVMLSVLLPPPVRVAISRAPADLESLRLHDRWAAFAAEHAPRIQFDVSDKVPPAPGEPCDFRSWVAHSSHITGTSIAEGLGLPFLDAGQWRRPFVGRRLLHLAHMVDPASTYDKLLVPSHWVARNVLREELATFLTRDDRVRQSHQRQRHLESILDRLAGSTSLDFGNLPESVQQAIIERCADPSSRDEMMVETDGKQLPATHWLEACVGRKSPDHFNPQTPPGDPIPLYEKLLSAPDATIDWIETEKIIRAYHTPESFHFLLAPPAPSSTPKCRYRVVIFDIYGTILRTPQGAVQPAPEKDPAIIKMIRSLGYEAPEQPTKVLHDAIRKHHANSPERYPEVDLRIVWAMILGVPPETPLERLVIATEDIRSSAVPVNGAFTTIRRLAQAGVRLGIISNAQCNALHSLHEIRHLFDPSLTLLSYRLGLAKPSAEIFDLMATRLEELGIRPADVLYVGDSPGNDIEPAKAQGWDTALIHSGTPSPIKADFTFTRFASLRQKLFPDSPA